MDLDAYLQKRLDAIQKRYNFNPSRGSKQVHGDPDPKRRDAFIEFRTLLGVLKHTDCEVRVPYDPSGLDPSGHLQSMCPKQLWVYFANIEGTTTWKVGFSNSPSRRKEEIQTHNAGVVGRMLTAPGDRQLEADVKRYLRRFKTRDRNKAQKGEWVGTIPDELVYEIWERLKVGDTDFLLSRVARKM